MKTIVTTLVVGLLISTISLANKTVLATDVDIGANSLERVIVIIEPPVNFKSAVVKLGYIIGEEFDMEALSMRALTVTFPVDRTFDSAISELEKHFPGIAVGDSEV